MSSPDVVIILVDQKLNIVTIPDGENASFLKTKIELKDYPFDKNVDMAAKNSVARFLSENYGVYINKQRLFDGSLVDESGMKTHVFIYKLDTTERLAIQMKPNISFVNITTLPLSFNPLSASVAVAITNNFDLFRKVPNPPGIIIINYPVQVPVYMPLVPVPVLTPLVIYRQPPKVITLTDNFSTEKTPDAPRVPRYSEQKSEQKSESKI